MIRYEELEKLLRRHYPAHPSARVMGKQVKGKSTYYYLPPSDELEDSLSALLQTMDLPDGDALSKIVIPLENKTVKPCYAKQWMIKVTKDALEKGQAELSLWGIKGIRLQKTKSGIVAAWETFARSILRLVVDLDKEIIWFRKERRLFPVVFDGYLDGLLKMREGFRHVMTEMLMLCGSSYPILKDVARAIEEKHFLGMDIPYTKIIQAHNINELLQKDQPALLPVNYNRRPLLEGYLLRSIAEYVKEGELPRLAQFAGSPRMKALFMRYIQKIHDEPFRRLEMEVYDLAADFLTEFYAGQGLYEKETGGNDACGGKGLHEVNLDVSDREGIGVVKGYFFEAHEGGEKVSLRFHSIKRIERECNRLRQKKLAEREDDSPMIAEESRFRDLRKCLPDSMEWISSMKRLYTEAECQHNCVVSYASDIREDKCAIYHWETEGREYTIEFRVRGDAYYIAQMKQSYNVAADYTDRQYIEGML